MDANDDDDDEDDVDVGSLERYSRPPDNDDVYRSFLIAKKFAEALEWNSISVLAEPYILQRWKRRTGWEGEREQHHQNGLPEKVMVAIFVWFLTVLQFSQCITNACTAQQTTPVNNNTISMILKKICRFALPFQLSGLYKIIC